MEKVKIRARNDFVKDITRHSNFKSSFMKKGWETWVERAYVRGSKGNYKIPDNISFHPEANKYCINFESKDFEIIQDDVPRGVKKGDIVVRTNLSVRKNTMFEVFKDHAIKAYSSAQGWRDPGDFRFATKEEIKAYNQGIRDITRIGKVEEKEEPNYPYKVGDRISFKFKDGTVYNYVIKNGYFNCINKCHNNVVFKKLGIKTSKEQHAYCKSAYGYNHSSKKGEFPYYKDYDLKAINNIIVALRKSIREYDADTTKLDASAMHMFGTTAVDPIPAIPEEKPLSKKLHQTAQVFKRRAKKRKLIIKTKK